jgi:hypothetical protein
MSRTSGDPKAASSASAPVALRALPAAGGNPYYTVNCKHANTLTSGCMYCCDACNYDRHLCYGCGDNVPHGHGACPECDEVHNVEEKEVQ